MAQQVHLRVRVTQRKMQLLNGSVVHNSARILGNQVTHHIVSGDNLDQCWGQASELVFNQADLGHPFKLETRVVGHGDPTWKTASGRALWSEAQAASYNLGYLQHAVTEGRDLQDFSAEGYADALSGARS